MNEKKKTGNGNRNTPKIWKMFGISLFGSSKSRLLSVLKEQNVSKDSKVWIATVNPEFVMAAEKDRYFKEILGKTTFNVIDGIGLIWGLKVRERSRINNSGIMRVWNGLRTGVEILQGRHREALITGADLMDDLCAAASRLGKSVYFYGGWDDRSKLTAEYFLKKYPKLKVAGYRAEEFDFETEADYLFVARAMKKQEEWIDEHWDKLKVKLVMGVGRSFDYYSGKLLRAPKWVRKMGMEWLFSLLMEPKRWRRQLELPKFIYMVVFGR